jgi:hypothetical protein
MAIDTCVLTKKEPSIEEGFDRRVEGCIMCEKSRFTNEGKPLWKSEHTLFTNSPYAIKVTVCRECRHKYSVWQLFNKIYKCLGITNLTDEPFNG